MSRPRIGQRDMKPLVVKFRLSEFYDPSDNTYKFRDNDGDAIFTIDPNDGTISFGSPLIFSTAITFSSTATFDGTSTFNGDVAFNGTVTGLDTANFVKISTQTASSDSSIDFTSGIDSTYRDYLFIITKARCANDNVNLLAQFSTDGGSNFLADGNYHFGYAHTYGGGGAFQGGSSQNNIELGVNIGNASAESISTMMYLHSPSATDTYKTVNFSGSHIANDGNTVGDIGHGGYVGSTSAINAIRFILSGGNIASGKFTLYGRLTD